MLCVLGLNYIYPEGYGLRLHTINAQVLLRIPPNSQVCLKNSHEWPLFVQKLGYNGSAC